MFEKFDWRGVRTVYTIGLHGSNQARPLAACPPTPLFAILAALCVKCRHVADAIRAAPMNDASPLCDA